MLLFLRKSIVSRLIPVERYGNFSTSTRTSTPLSFALKSASLILGRVKVYTDIHTRFFEESIILINHDSCFGQRMILALSKNTSDTFCLSWDIWCSLYCDISILDTYRYSTVHMILIEIHFFIVKNLIYRNNNLISLEKP